MNPFLDTQPSSSRNADPPPGTFPLRPIRQMGLGCPRAGAETVLLDVARRFGVTVAELRGKERHQTITRPRHVAAWLMRQQGMSLPEIGRAIGGRDHTTILSSVRRVDAALAADPAQRAVLLGLVRRESWSRTHVVPGEGAVFEGEETDAAPAAAAAE